MRRSKVAEGACLQLQRLLQWWLQDDDDDEDDDEEGIAVVNTTPSCMFTLNKQTPYTSPHFLPLIKYNQN